MIVTTNLKSKRIGCSHNRGTKVTVVDAGSAHSVLTVCTCFNMGYKLVNFSKVFFFLLPLTLFTITSVLHLHLAFAGHNFFKSKSIQYG